VKLRFNQQPRECIVASGISRNQWILSIVSVGSLFAAAAIAGTAAEQSPAASPQNAEAQPASADSAAAPAGASASETKPAAPRVQKVVLIDNDVNDEQLKQILAKGYRPESRDGTTVYCRKETEVGTRFPTKTCRTSANILEMERKGKDATANAQRTTGNPMQK
jgi:pyruvate/2-oxoglutarate dehydrogenase complex dihydrolipoamide acyltransferase (E2) component